MKDVKTRAVVRKGERRKMGNTDGASEVWETHLGKGLIWNLISYVKRQKKDTPEKWQDVKRLTHGKNLVYFNTPTFYYIISPIKIIEAHLTIVPS